MSPPLAGFGLAGHGATFAIVTGAFFQLVPRGHILGLSRALAYPARGAGYATLALHHAPPGLSKVRPHGLQLMSDHFSDHALQIEADSLARSLGVTCTQERYLDD